MRRKLFFAVLLTMGFLSTNKAETCTLEATGKCKCVALIENQVIVGYRCVDGTADAKCVCPPQPPEG